MTAGAVQATMVSSLPLPPKQRELDTGVLTPLSLPAPHLSPPKSAPSPSRSQRSSHPRKNQAHQAGREKPTPAPPKHPQPAPEQPTKAATGETAGIRIPQATMEPASGTASISVEDRTFGSRFCLLRQHRQSHRSPGTGTPRRPTPAPPRQERHPHLRHQPRRRPIQRLASKPAAAPLARPLRHARRTTSKASAPHRKATTLPSSTPSTTNPNNPKWSEVSLLITSIHTLPGTLSRMVCVYDRRDDFLARFDPPSHIPRGTSPILWLAALTLPCRLNLHPVRAGLVQNRDLFSSCQHPHRRS